MEHSDRYFIQNASPTTKFFDMTWYNKFASRSNLTQRIDWRPIKRLGNFKAESHFSQLASLFATKTCTIIFQYHLDRRNIISRSLAESETNKNCASPILLFFVFFDCFLFLISNNLFANMNILHRNWICRWINHAIRMMIILERKFECRYEKSIDT